MDKKCKTEISKICQKIKWDLVGTIHFNLNEYKINQRVYEQCCSAAKILSQQICQTFSCEYKYFIRFAYKDGFHAHFLLKIFNKLKARKYSYESLITDSVSLEHYFSGRNSIFGTKFREITKFPSVDIKVEFFKKEMVKSGGFVLYTLNNSHEPSRLSNLDIAGSACGDSEFCYLTNMYK